MSKKQITHPTQQKLARLLRWLRSEYTIKDVITSSAIQSFCTQEGLPKNFIFFLIEGGILKTVDPRRNYRRATYNIKNIPVYAGAIHELIKDYNSKAKKKHSKKAVAMPIIDLFNQPEAMPVETRQESDSMAVHKAIDLLKKSGYRVYRMVTKEEEV